MSATWAPPVVDLRALRAGPHAATATDIHQACLHTGFFVAVGHGVEEEMRAVFAASHAFFALPQADKERTPYLERYGYVPHEGEAVDTTRTAHRSEYLDLGLADEVPMPDVPGFARAVRDYQQAARSLGSLLLTVLAEQLGAPPTWFLDRMTEPQCRLRLLHYRPTPALRDGTLAVPAAPHTDYGALTLLATDGVPGLEVQPIGGDWTPVVAPPGSLVVNLGDMLARWTNDVYRSTPHRVVGSTEQHRYSIPFFVNPNPDAVIDCVPSCVRADRPARYAPVRAGDYLRARIDGAAEPYLDPTAAPARTA